MGQLVCSWKKLPGGDFVVDTGGNFEIDKGISQGKARELTELISQYLTRNFGNEFTERLFLNTYSTLRETNGEQLEARKVLEFIPEGYLEEEKVKILSKEELEARVLERTRKLQELNLTLEQRVVMRTKELAGANKKLEEKNKRLQDLSQAKTEFVSLVSHQMLTPLSSVRMALYELKGILERSRRKEVKDLLFKMIVTNERSIRLIENLLNIARIEEGRILYRFENVRLDSLVQEALEGLEAKARQRSITIQYDAPHNLPLVKADKEKFYLVIENILSNAISYTKPRGNIEIRTEPQEHTVLLSIKDSGMGIPEKDQQKIFTKFFRAENAAKNTHGTGLGLFIAKQITQAHGGTISFTSVEGKGTTFLIQIPILASQPMAGQPFKNA